MQQKTPGKNSSPPTPPIGENNQVGQKNPRPNSPLFVPLDTDEARDEVTDYDPTVGRPLSNKERSSKKKSTGAKKRKRGQNTVDLGSLAMSADTFTSIQALPDGETVDTRHRLDAKTKKEALNHLIASIPEVHRAAARGDKTYLNEQLKKFTGQGSCRAGEGSEGWILRGLRSRLKHYQMTGVAWMRENEGTDALGGILADSMGLGKTVMTIANIVNGLEDPLAETLPTLICVPSSLLAQWEAELNKHIDQDWLRKKNLQMVVPFHHKMESEPFVRLLEGAFIVLTTHHEVRRSCSKVKFPTDISTAEEREAWFKENRNKLRGILYKIRWRRFVIDEAHCIKYHQSQTSLAMREINARYRWAISGTPITNGPNELYPYFRLLKVPMTGTHRNYCQNYDVKTNEGQRRLQALLNKYMIRRTASDKLLGQPILLLPKATQQTEWLHFNPIEMEIYNIVRYRAVEQINRESRLGRLNLQFVLVRILRLRQICSHILLALDAASEMFTPDDLRKLEELAIKESHPSKGQERIRQIATLRKILKRQEANAAETIDLTAEPHTPKERESSLEVTVGGQHGLRYEPMKWIERACANGPDEVILDDRCGSCGKMPPNRPVRTSCGHLYCEPCINQICVSAFAEGSSGGICIVCNVEYENAQPCAIPVKRETADGDSVRGKKDERKAPKRPDAFLDGVDDKDILASAKTYGCKSYILNCFDDVKKGENTKVIVFSQFIGMLCILRRMCDQEGWMSVMYYGGMKLEERTDAIKQFEKFDGNCILLSSLKCGGLGLNLTMASRVLNIDPFWNVAIEQQAFGRVHRIGQEKTTNFTRLFVRGTIDERIMDLQEEKQKYIQMLFEGGKRSGFPHKDLLGLFGETKTDEAGNIFIVPTDHYEMAPFFDDDAWERWQDGAEKRPRMEFQRYY